MTAQQVINGWASKAMGKQGAVSPPPMPTREVMYTFVGVFCTLLLLSALSEFVKDISSDQYFLLLGNFGATMTLQFGLPNAPASQPRNALIGTTVAAGVAVAVNHIPEEILPIWIRVALTPALAISAMAKLGVTHPPGGAAALIFASGGAMPAKLGWMYLIFPLFFGNVIVIVMATIFNNLSANRQYPTYWHLTKKLW